MIALEVNDVAIVQQKEWLEKALSSNKRMESRLRKLIGKVLAEARAEVVKDIKFKDGDPRNARQAVRRITYKKILGGNLNILSPKKRHSATNYEPPRKLRPGQRGGNRRPRSQRTYQMQSYSGPDRWMILMWKNEGTRERYSGFGRMPTDQNQLDRRILHTGGRGYRGRILTSNFFRTLGGPALEKAAIRLSQLIDQELEKMHRKGEL